MNYDAPATIALAQLSASPEAGVMATEQAHRLMKANKTASAAQSQVYGSPNRGLRREAAAHYVGVSPSKLDQLVADGRMPKPFRIDGCVVWDRYELDAAFDALRDEDDNHPDTGSWDDFK